MRVVLDSNIMISSLLSPAGVPGRIVTAWINRRFVLISHSWQLDEMRSASRYPKLRGKLRPARVGEFINRLGKSAVMPGRLPTVSRSADSDDDFLLAIAAAGQADRLVSGDRRGLLDLATHGSTRIVTARAFADELGI